MRQLLLHNIRLLPNDHDLMQLPLDDVRALQSQLQQELSKLSHVNFHAKKSSNRRVFFFFV